MNDEELDELIVSRLRNRLEQTGGSEFSDATQSASDLASSFNEPEIRIEARIIALASQGRITQSPAMPGRWALPQASEH
jgi:hypothetical protein